MEDKSAAIDRLGFHERGLVHLLREQGIPRQQQTEIYQHVKRIASAYADLYILCSTEEERNLVKESLNEFGTTGST